MRSQTLITCLMFLTIASPCMASGILVPTDPVNLGTSPTVEKTPAEKAEIQKENAPNMGLVPNAPAPTASAPEKPATPKKQASATSPIIPTPKIPMKDMKLPNGITVQVPDTSKMNIPAIPMKDMKLANGTVIKVPDITQMKMPDGSPIKMPWSDLPTQTLTIKFSKGYNFTMRDIGKMTSILGYSNEQVSKYCYPVAIGKIITAAGTTDFMTDAQGVTSTTYQASPIIVTAEVRAACKAMGKKPNDYSVTEIGDYFTLPIQAGICPRPPENLRTITIGMVGDNMKCTYP